MKSETAPTTATILLLPVPLLMLLVTWQLATASDPHLRFQFSSPMQIAECGWRMLTSGQLLMHWGVTLSEAVLGFVAGNVVGSVIGLMFWHSKLAASVAKPYISAAASIPIFALAPLLIVWFGIGLPSKVALAFLSTVIMALVQSYRGAQAVEDRYLKFFQVVKATRMQVFQMVVVPSSLAWVVNGFKLNVGLALLGAFMGEFISSEAGLGYVIVKASGLYDMATVFVGIIMLMLTAIFLSWLVELLEQRLLCWQYK